LLDVEGELWKRRLHWDYRSSAKLLMQYLDSHMLPGYAALEAGQVTGYAFCVYEETKAVIGDVFAFAKLLHSPLPRPLPRGPDSASQIFPSPHEVEETLLRHLFELLQNSPQIDRIESPTPAPSFRAPTPPSFAQAGFQVFRRLFMVQPLQRPLGPAQVTLPSGLELRPWRDEDMRGKPSHQRGPMRITPTA